MKKRPVTLLCLLWFSLFLAGCCYFASVSGVQYHEDYALAIEYDADLAELIRISIEEANVLSAIGIIGCLFVSFLLWWLSCLPVVVIRMKKAAISRPALRYISSFAPYIVAMLIVEYVLEKGRPIFGMYDECLNLLTLPAAVLMIGSLGSIVMIFMGCHLPWKRALIQKKSELG